MGRVRDWWGNRHATRIRADRSLVNRHQGRRVGCKTRLSLWSTGRKADHASSRETKFKPQMAQGITDATSTGENGEMRRNNSMLCNELIHYAVRIAWTFALTALKVVAFKSVDILKSCSKVKDQRLSKTKNRFQVLSRPWNRFPEIQGFSRVFKGFQDAYEPCKYITDNQLWVFSRTCAHDGKFFFRFVYFNTVHSNLDPGELASSFHVKQNYRIQGNLFTYHCITIVSIVICFVLQKPPTHVSEVDQSGPVFYGCRERVRGW